MVVVTQKRIDANRKNALSPFVGRPVGSVEETTAYKKAFTAYVLERLIENEGQIITAMIKKAVGGDVTAFTALRDTAIGKPAQAVEMTGKDGNPIVFMPLELIQKHALQVASKVVEYEEKPIEPVSNELMKG